jgi:hypothetical protein
MLPPHHRGVASSSTLGASGASAVSFATPDVVDRSAISHRGGSLWITHFPMSGMPVWPAEWVAAVAALIEARASCASSEVRALASTADVERAAA